MQQPKNRRPSAGKRKPPPVTLEKPAAIQRPKGDRRPVNAAAPAPHDKGGRA